MTQREGTDFVKEPYIADVSLLLLYMSFINNRINVHLEFSVHSLHGLHQRTANQGSGHEPTQPTKAKIHTVSVLFLAAI